MDYIKIPKVEKVQLVDRFKQGRLGTLYVTTTHLIFIPESGGHEIWLLHSCLATMERGSLTAAGVSLIVRSKTFHSLYLLIPKDRDATDLLTTLSQLARPNSLSQAYAFSYIPALGGLRKGEGWDQFPLADDFIRQGLPNDNWIQTDFNQNYEHCDTYDRELWVPAKATKQLLIGSSKFRSRGRLPVLSYFHSPTQATISRCSQPLAGFSARCDEDERLIDLHRSANPNCATLYVVDTRPRLNAMANKAQGKGFEDERHYPGTRFHFLNIDNIHVMRNSLHKLCEVSSGRGTGMSGFLGGLESSGWLRHVKGVLEAGLFVADAVSRGISCLVHCSDGWDRTAQTCAIAALLLDPHYRTLEGFLTLIQRDWLSFGHKFSDRCAHTATATGGATEADESGAKKESSNKEVGGVGKEFSPIFTQWLDAVWQITRQFPQAFQFSQRLLFELHDHVHSCQFGTFLGNCPKDREDLQLESKTYSLWPFLLRQRQNFLNPLYDPDSVPAKSSGILRPDLRPQSLVFWSGLYSRQEDGVHPRESQTQAADAAFAHVAILQEHERQLQRRLEELKRGGAEGGGGVGMGDSGLSSGGEALGSPTGEVASLNRLGMSPSLASLDLSCLDIGAAELSSVAVRWESLRAGEEGIACGACAKGLAQTEAKSHCTRCGRIHCRACLAEPAAGTLPGLSPGRKLLPSLCRVCSKDLL